jgi:peptide/nickel transport system substrate-binding protein
MNNIVVPGLQSDGVDRRAFITGAVALGIASALPGVGSAQTPKRGGRLILALSGGSTGDTLDPAWGAGTFINVVKRLVYDNPIEVDQKLMLRPALAEEWSSSADLKRWSIKLRRGVQFHNGKEMSADDVIYSINHHRGPEAKSTSKQLFALITEIKKAGKYEILITLGSGYVDFPYVLAEYGLGIGPEGATFADGLGTGPYILESFEPGVRALFKRNPNDWQSNRGFVSSIEIHAMNDSTARINALQTNAVHLANYIDPKVLPRLQQNPQLQIFSYGGHAHFTFAMRCDTPPFDNLDLRLALKYAINRDAVLKTVLGGQGKVGNDQPIPAIDPFYADDIPQRSYDPERARFHLKKSGFSGPIPLTVSEVGFQGAIDAAQLYQASAAAAGIDLQIDRVPNDGYFSKVWRVKPFCACLWGGRPSPGLQFAIVYKSDAPWNDTYWKRPAFDDLLAASQIEPDIVKRKQLYGRMQKMIHEDGGQIVHTFNNFINAGHTKVRNFIPVPTYDMGGWTAPSRVWLDE